ncbi:MAG: hypothetical protein HRT61_10460 [Ekhidna sp.]|nr:hypothetical protein [Ekhidna sp.]
MKVAAQGKFVPKNQPLVKYKASNLALKDKLSLQLSVGALVKPIDRLFFADAKGMIDSLALMTTSVPNLNTESVFTVATHPPTPEPVKLEVESPAKASTVEQPAIQAVVTPEPAVTETVVEKVVSSKYEAMKKRVYARIDASALWRANNFDRVEVQADDVVHTVNITDERKESPTCGQTLDYAMPQAYYDFLLIERQATKRFTNIALGSGKLHRSVVRGEFGTWQERFEPCATVESTTAAFERKAEATVHSQRSRTKDSGKVSYTLLRLKEAEQAIKLRKANEDINDTLHAAHVTDIVLEKMEDVPFAQADNEREKTVSSTVPTTEVNNFSQKNPARRLRFTERTAAAMQVHRGLIHQQVILDHITESVLREHNHGDPYHAKLTVRGVDNGIKHYPRNTVLYPRTFSEDVLSHYRALFEVENVTADVMSPTWMYDALHDEALLENTKRGAKPSGILSVIWKGVKKVMLVDETEISEETLYTHIDSMNTSCASVTGDRDASRLTEWLAEAECPAYYNRYASPINPIELAATLVGDSSMAHNKNIRCDRTMITETRVISNSVNHAVSTILAPDFIPGLRIVKNKDRSASTTLTASDLNFKDMTNNELAALDSVGNAFLRSDALINNKTSSSWELGLTASRGSPSSVEAMAAQFDLTSGGIAVPK